MSVEVATALRKAKGLIGTPEKWVQGAYRRAISDACGCAVGMRYCATGAVIEVTHNDRLRTSAMDALRRAVERLYPEHHGYSASYWNDQPQRTHPEVMAAFDEAIAREEAMA